MTSRSSTLLLSPSERKIVASGLSEFIAQVRNVMHDPDMPDTKYRANLRSISRAQGLLMRMGFSEE